MCSFFKSVAECQAVPRNKPPGVQYRRLEPYKGDAGKGEQRTSRGGGSTMNEGRNPNEGGPRAQETEEEG